jgi:hypothetical protein
MVDQGPGMVTQTWSPSYVGGKSQASPGKKIPRPYLKNKLKMQKKGCWCGLSGRGLT